MTALIILCNNISLEIHRWLKRNFTAIFKNKKEGAVMNISGFSLFSSQTRKDFTSIRSRLTVSKNVTTSIPDHF